MGEIIFDKTLLTQKSVDVDDEKEADLISQKLLSIAKSSEHCVGLSAVQIGILKNVFVALIRNKFGVYTWTTFVNPKILKKTHETTLSEEGCMSFPGARVLIKRAKQITVTDDNNGKLVLFGTDSIVFQHEYDHLNGIVCVDKGKVLTNGGSS